MNLLVNHNEAHLIAINKYHRNFAHAQNYAGTFNFELIINNELERNLQFLQSIYGSNTKIRTLQIQHNDGRNIMEFYPNNCYIVNLTDSLQDGAKRTVLLSFSFDSYSSDSHLDLTL